MKVRFKTFSEFGKGLRLVHCDDGGVKLVCYRTNRVVVQSPSKLWSSKDTRKSFLVKLYINEVLWKANPSKLIQRIKGYEILGKRVMYNNMVAVVADSFEAVHKETGEVQEILVIVNNWRVNPFQVLKSRVEL
jgi:hypothetical protein